MFKQKLQKQATHQLFVFYFLEVTKDKVLNTLNSTLKI